MGLMASPSGDPRGGAGLAIQPPWIDNGGEHNPEEPMHCKLLGVGRRRESRWLRAGAVVVALLLPSAASAYFFTPTCGNGVSDSASAVNRSVGVPSTYDALTFTSIATLPSSIPSNR